MSLIDKTTRVDVKSMLPRRSRIRYTNEQIKRLENVFSNSQYPDSSTQEQIANDFGVSVERIHIWFQNRRSKFKRTSKTDHVMWMRKQIFDNDDDKGLAFPFGTPRLPSLTNSCHVLSPPDAMQCARQDVAWEKPTVNLKTQHSPPVEFSHILDLRTSPESKPSTPNSIHKLPSSFRENRHHGNRFADVSFSPCRYTSPPPAHISSPLTMLPKHRFPSVLPPTFPRKILSPIGFHGNGNGNDLINNTGVHDLPYRPYFQRWLPASVLSPPGNVYETLPMVGQIDGNSSYPPGSGVINTRKRAFDENVDCINEDNKRVKLSTDVEPVTLSDTYASELKETEEMFPEKDPDYNCDSSLQVDLELFL